jgi:hypothetical protein
VLFLATGATHAEDALVLLGDESNPSYYTIVNSPWSCLETLERHLANQEKHLVELAIRCAFCAL